MEHAEAQESGPSAMSSCLPLLVFDHHPRGEEDGINEMLMYSISKRSLHKNMEPGLLAVNNVLCWTTPQGWMIVTQEHDPAAASSSAWLWNPCTGDKLPLPDVGDEILFHLDCLLTHKDPTHPGCVAVLFSSDKPEFWYCHTAGGDGDGSHSWRHHSYDIGSCASVPKPPKGKKARRSIRPIKRVIYDMTSFRKGLCAIDFSPRASGADHSSRPIRFQKFNIPSVARFISPKACPRADTGWLSRNINSLQSPLPSLALIRTTLAP